MQLEKKYYTVQDEETLDLMFQHIKIFTKLISCLFNTLFPST